MPEDGRGMLADPVEVRLAAGEIVAALLGAAVAPAPAETDGVEARWLAQAASRLPGIEAAPEVLAQAMRHPQDVDRPLARVAAVFGKLELLQHPVDELCVVHNLNASPGRRWRKASGRGHGAARRLLRDKIGVRILPKRSMVVPPTRNSATLP